MEYRSDALVAASEMIMGMQDIPRKYEGSVLTNGYINVEPNAINVIPDKVVFSIDVRTPSIEDLKKIEKDIKGIVHGRALKFTGNNSVSIDKTTNVNPVSLWNSQTAELERKINERSIRYMPINSGAGHDSSIFSGYLPTSMPFVPSKNGYSHRPNEYTDITYIRDSVDVLCNYLK